MNDEHRKWLICIFYKIIMLAYVSAWKLCYSRASPFSANGQDLERNNKNWYFVLDFLPKSKMFWIIRKAKIKDQQHFLECEMHSVLCCSSHQHFLIPFFTSQNPIGTRGTGLHLFRINWVNISMKFSCTHHKILAARVLCMMSSVAVRWLAC